MTGGYGLVMPRAESATYDGIPYADLPFTGVDWAHRGDYIRTRSLRKGRAEFDVEPEWATEAVFDPNAVVRDGRSKSGETIEVVGRSIGANRILAVHLLGKDTPVAGEWWGINAWAADRSECKLYEDTPGADEQTS